MGETSVDYQEQLLRFGYTRQWVDSGFLTEAGLRSQVDQQRLGGDSNFEHFRYATFKAWIQGRDSASDEAVANFTELVFSDPDKTMAGSAWADLLDTPWITESQFEFLARKSGAFGAWAEKRVARAKVIRELDQGRWNQALFEMAMALKDRSVHDRLIAHPELSGLQLQRLAQEGANKGIRTRAEEALRSKRFSPGIIGVWHPWGDEGPDHSVEIEFLEDGRMFYSILQDGKWQIIILTYHLEGDCIVSNQPSAPRVERTTFSIDRGQVLALTYDGTTTRYRRGEKMSPANPGLSAHA